MSTVLAAHGYPERYLVYRASKKLKKVPKPLSMAG